MFETVTENNRLQPCDMQVQSGTSLLLHKQIMYGGGGQEACGPQAQNNGNVQSILDLLEPQKSGTLWYDVLNRLTQAVRSDGAYNMNYQLDSFGNALPVNLGTGYHPAGMYADAQNRLQNSLSPFTYDNAGHLLSRTTPLAEAHTAAPARSQWYLHGLSQTAAARRHLPQIPQSLDRALP